MIDKIIEYSNDNVDKDKIDDLEQEIINSNNARLMFLYAYYFSNRDLKNISEALIKTNDERYISFFFRYIKNTYGVDFKIDEQHIEHIVGHHDLNPIVRLSCPGDKFPIKEIIQDLKKIYSKKRK